jgi:hypothetical protein
MTRNDTRLGDAIAGVFLSAINVLIIQFLLLTFIPKWAIDIGIAVFSVFWWIREARAARAVWNSDSPSSLSISVVVLVMDIYLFFILP